MNFQRVPKLGAFMAIPLVYNSCLFNESLTESVANFQDVTARQKQQDEDMEHWETQQHSAREHAVNQGTEYEEEEKEWPDINLEEFRTQEEKYVVCLDTMGQDREISDEQKEFALTTIERFIQIWE